MKTKKLIGTMLAAMLCATLAQAQQPSVTKLWTSEANLPIPESVLYSPDDKVLYVSLIDGKPWDKDGQGGIAKVGLDGKIISNTWVTGLHAPKGMGIVGNRLYAADVDEVVVIDRKSGKIEQKIAIEGAKHLNDVSANKKGEVYVTDMETGKIHLIKGGEASTYYETSANPNGVLAVNDGLLMAIGGKLVKLDAKKNVTTLAEGMDASTDGIEEIKPGEYIVSCWSGIVYHVKADGSKETLLDTRGDKINSADIGYDPAKKIIYVPTFMKNNVTAYQLR
ncbi:ATP/GTP-binding protein [Telluribacter sp.]|jgi:DNA-binding beta-propeller fold protein YncE|uniref:ATP/GTP-binding protein n=1 Tax=Telluribacter sp. TaxID=1978767 RepID=UPI002E0D3599|nr:ATP/GTP-binding protein [Telluribacter sp.]